MKIIFFLGGGGRGGSGRVGGVGLGGGVRVDVKKVLVKIQKKNSGGGGRVGGSGWM